MKKQLLLVTATLLFTVTGFAQLQEAFENTAGPETSPATNWTLGSGNWAVFDNGVGNTSRWGITSAVTSPPSVYQGANSAYIGPENIGEGNTSKDFLATSLVAIQSNAQLHFYSKTLSSGNQGTTYSIYIAPASASQTDSNAYTLVQLWTENQIATSFNTYEEKIVDLSVYAGMAVYIAFVREYSQTTPTGGGDSWFIDNVSIIDSPCLAPTNVGVTNVQSNTVNVNWTENNLATVWHVLLTPAGGAAPTAVSTGWSVATSNPFSLAGLSPNTAYDIYVRAACNSTFSDWSSGTTVTTPYALPVCGGNFLDQGGSTGNYPNNSNYITTICPSNPGDAVSVTFLSFNTEAFADALYVYDGTSIAAPMIPSTNPSLFLPGSQPGGYWGNTIPGPFTASNNTGCLTFRFLSDGTNTSEGWIANVDCIPMLCEAPTGLGISNITENNVTLSWNNPPFSSISVIMILPDGASSPYEAPSSSNMAVIPTIPGQCYTATIKSMCSNGTEWSAWSAPIHFCAYSCENNATCPENLVLIAFLDNNNNGVKDTDEINFNDGFFVYQVNDNNTNQYGYTNSGTYYIFDQNPTNSYDITFALNSNVTGYYASTVSHNNITLPTGSGANTLYFPITTTQPHMDAQVSMYSYGQPVPGFTYGISIYYSNNGTQPIANGTLTYTKDPNTTINSISQSGTVTTSTGFTYNFTNLAPFESRNIFVSLTVPTIPTVNLGQLINHSVSIDCTNDVDLSNNNAAITQVVLGSYDPNDKSESHGGKIGLDNFTNNEYLYYTVQFENTGTANAQFIRVEDVLDAGLDESTFQMISASHTVNTKREGNQLTWHFYNINLPPTVNNPSASHGYVHFKIKPKSGFAVGDIIPNKAAIYFDYNPAIITNTCNTEFVQSLLNPSFTANTITLYPNPASSVVQITNSLNETITNVALYEVSGKLVKQLTETNNSQITVDLQNLAKGLYFVEISTASNTKQIKKLIIQ